MLCNNLQKNVFYNIIFVCVFIESGNLILVTLGTASKSNVSSWKNGPKNVPI